MNNKDIEGYVKENRKAFDQEIPSDKLWARIEAGLDKEKTKKSIRFPIWLSVAASLGLVMGMVLFFNYRKAEHHIDLGDINQRYARKELRFASLIEEKKDSLQIYASKNPELYASFSADLDKLGSDYEQLRKELQQSPNQRIVARAMVKNLELQLQVINQQLSIFNEVNQYREENHL